MRRVETHSQVPSSARFPSQGESCSLSTYELLFQNRVAADRLCMPHMAPCWVTMVCYCACHPGCAQQIERSWQTSATQSHDIYTNHQQTMTKPFVNKHWSHYKAIDQPAQAVARLQNHYSHQKSLSFLHGCSAVLVWLLIWLEHLCMWSSLSVCDLASIYLTW